MAGSSDRNEAALDFQRALVKLKPLGFRNPLLPPLPPLGSNWMQFPLWVLFKQYASETELEEFRDIFDFWNFGGVQENSLNGLPFSMTWPTDTENAVELGTLFNVPLDNSALDSLVPDPLALINSEVDGVDRSEVEVQPSEGNEWSEAQTVDRFTSDTDSDSAHLEIDPASNGSTEAAISPEADVNESYPQAYAVVPEVPPIGSENSSGFDASLSLQNAPLGFWGAEAFNRQTLEDLTAVEPNAEFTAANSPPEFSASRSAEEQLRTAEHPVEERPLEAEQETQLSISQFAQSEREPNIDALSSADDTASFSDDHHEHHGTSLTVEQGADSVRDGQNINFSTPSAETSSPGDLHQSDSKPADIANQPTTVSPPEFLQEASGTGASSELQPTQSSDELSPEDVGLDEIAFERAVSNQTISGETNSAEVTEVTIDQPACLEIDPPKSEAPQVDALFAAPQETLSRKERFQSNENATPRTTLAQESWAGSHDLAPHSAQLEPQPLNAEDEDPEGVAFPLVSSSEQVTDGLQSELTAPSAETEASDDRQHSTQEQSRGFPDETLENSNKNASNFEPTVVLDTSDTPDSFENAQQKVDAISNSSTHSGESKSDSIPQAESLPLDVKPGIEDPTAIELVQTLDKSISQEAPEDLPTQLVLPDEATILPLVAPDVSVEESTPEVNGSLEVAEIAEPQSNAPSASPANSGEDVDVLELLSPVTFLQEIDDAQTTSFFGKHQTVSIPAEDQLDIPAKEASTPTLEGQPVSVPAPAQAATPTAASEPYSESKDAQGVVSQSDPDKFEGEPESASLSAEVPKQAEPEKESPGWLQRGVDWLKSKLGGSSNTSEAIQPLAEDSEGLEDSDSNNSGVLSAASSQDAADQVAQNQASQADRLFEGSPTTNPLPDIFHPESDSNTLVTVENNDSISRSAEEVKGQSSSFEVERSVIWFEPPVDDIQVSTPPISESNSESNSGQVSNKPVSEDLLDRQMEQTTLLSEISPRPETKTETSYLREETTLENPLETNGEETALNPGDTISSNILEDDSALTEDDIEPVSDISLPPTSDREVIADVELERIQDPESVLSKDPEPLPDALTEQFSQKSGQSRQNTLPSAPSESPSLTDSIESEETTLDLPSHSEHNKAQTRDSDSRSNADLPVEGRSIRSEKSESPQTDWQSPSSTEEKNQEINLDLSTEHSSNSLEQPTQLASQEQVSGSVHDVSADENFIRSEAEAIESTQLQHLPGLQTPTDAFTYEQSQVSEPVEPTVLQNFSETGDEDFIRSTNDNFSDQEYNSDINDPSVLNADLTTDLAASAPVEDARLPSEGLRDLVQSDLKTNNSAQNFTSNIDSEIDQAETHENLDRTASLEQGKLKSEVSNNTDSASTLSSEPINISVERIDQSDRPETPRLEEVALVEDVEQRPESDPIRPVDSSASALNNEVLKVSQNRQTVDERSFLVEESPTILQETVDQEILQPEDAETTHETSQALGYSLENPNQQSEEAITGQLFSSLSEDNVTVPAPERPQQANPLQEEFSADPNLEPAHSTESLPATFLLASDEVADRSSSSLQENTTNLQPISEGAEGDFSVPEESVASKELENVLPLSSQYTEDTSSHKAQSDTLLVDQFLNGNDPSVSLEQTSDDVNLDNSQVEDHGSAQSQYLSDSQDLSVSVVEDKESPTILQEIPYQEEVLPRENNDAIHETSPELIDSLENNTSHETEEAALSQASDSSSAERGNLIAPTPPFQENPSQAFNPGSKLESGLNAESMPATFLLTPDQVADRPSSSLQAESNNLQPTFTSAQDEPVAYEEYVFPGEPDSTSTQSTEHPSLQTVQSNPLIEQELDEKSSIFTQPDTINAKPSVLQSEDQADAIAGEESQVPKLVEPTTLQVQSNKDISLHHSADLVDSSNEISAKSDSQIETNPTQISVSQRSANAVDSSGMPETESVRSFKEEPESSSERISNNKGEANTSETLLISDPDTLAQNAAANEPRRLSLEQQPDVLASDHNKGSESVENTFLQVSSEQESAAPAVASSSSESGSLESNTIQANDSIITESQVSGEQKARATQISSSQSAFVEQQSLKEPQVQGANIFNAPSTDDEQTDKADPLNPLHDFEVLEDTSESLLVADELPTADKILLTTNEKTVLQTEPEPVVTEAITPNASPSATSQLSDPEPRLDPELSQDIDNSTNQDLENKNYERRISDSIGNVPSESNEVRQSLDNVYDPPYRSEDTILPETKESLSASLKKDEDVDIVSEQFISQVVNPAEFYPDSYRQPPEEIVSNSSETAVGVNLPKGPEAQDYRTPQQYPDPQDGSSDPLTVATPDSPLPDRFDDDSEFQSHRQPSERDLSVENNQVDRLQGEENTVLQTGATPGALPNGEHINLQSDSSIERSGITEPTGIASASSSTDATALSTASVDLSVEELQNNAVAPGTATNQPVTDSELSFPSPPNASLREDFSAPHVSVQSDVSSDNTDARESQTERRLSGDNEVNGFQQEESTFLQPSPVEEPASDVNYVNLQSDSPIQQSNLADSAELYTDASRASSSEHSRDSVNAQSEYTQQENVINSPAVDDSFNSTLDGIGDRTDTALQDFSESGFDPSAQSSPGAAEYLQPDSPNQELAQQQNAVSQDDRPKPANETNRNLDRAFFDQGPSTAELLSIEEQTSIQEDSVSANEPDSSEVIKSKTSEQSEFRSESRSQPSSIAATNAIAVEGSFRQDSQDVVKPSSYPSQPIQSSQNLNQINAPDRIQSTVFSNQSFSAQLSESNLSEEAIGHQLDLEVNGEKRDAISLTSSDAPLENVESISSEDFRDPNAIPPTAEQTVLQQEESLSNPAAESVENASFSLGAVNSASPTSNEVVAPVSENPLQVDALPQTPPYESRPSSSTSTENNLSFSRGVGENAQDSRIYASEHFVSEPVLSNERNVDSTAQSLPSDDQWVSEDHEEIDETVTSPHSAPEASSPTFEQQQQDLEGFSPPGAQEDSFNQINRTDLSSETNTENRSNPEIQYSFDRVTTEITPPATPVDSVVPQDAQGHVSDSSALSSSPALAQSYSDASQTHSASGSESLEIITESQNLQPLEKRQTEEGSPSAELPSRQFPELIDSAAQPHSSDDINPFWNAGLAQDLRSEFESPSNQPENLTSSSDILDTQPTQPSGTNDSSGLNSERYNHTSNRDSVEDVPSPNNPLGSNEQGAQNRMPRNDGATNSWSSRSSPQAVAPDSWSSLEDLLSFGQNTVAQSSNSTVSNLMQVGNALTAQALIGRPLIDSPEDFFGNFRVDSTPEKRNVPLPEAWETLSDLIDNIKLPKTEEQALEIEDVLAPSEDAQEVDEQINFSNKIQISPALVESVDPEVPQLLRQNLYERIQNQLEIERERQGNAFKSPPRFDLYAIDSMAGLNPTFLTEERSPTALSAQFDEALEANETSLGDDTWEIFQQMQYARELERERQGIYFWETRSAGSDTGF